MSDVPEEDETISRMPRAVMEAQIIDTMSDIFEEDEMISQMPAAVAEEMSVETVGAGADEWLEISQPSVSEDTLGNADAEGIPLDLHRNDQMPATLTMFLPPRTTRDSQDVVQAALTEDGAALEGKAAPCADADSRSVTAASDEQSLLEGTEKASTESPSQTVTSVPPVTPPVRDVQDVQDLGSQEGAGSIRRRQWTSSGKPSPRPALAVPAEEEDWGGVTLNKCLLVALLLVGVGFGIFGPATHSRPDQDPEQLKVDSEPLDKQVADENHHGDADVPPGSSLWIDPTLEKPGGTPHTFSSLKEPVDNKSSHIQAKHVELEVQTAKLNPLVREEGRQRVLRAAEGPEGREEEVGRQDGGKQRWKEEERVRQRDGEEGGRKRWDKDVDGWHKVRDKQGRHQPDGKDGRRQEKQGRHQRVEGEGGRQWQDGDKGSRQWYKEGREVDKRPVKGAGTEQRSEGEGGRRWGGKEGRRAVEGDRRGGGKGGRRGVEGDRRGGKEGRRVEEGDRRWAGKEGRRGDKERGRWWDKKDEWRGDEQGRQRVNEGRRGEEGGKFHGVKVSRQGDWKGDRWRDKKDGRWEDGEGGKWQEGKEWCSWWGDGSRRQCGEQRACGDVLSCAKREGQELFGLDLPPVTEPQLASAIADYVRQSGLNPVLAQQLNARAASFFRGGVFAHHQERLATFLDRLEEEVEEAAERELGDDDAVTDFEDYVWARLVGEEAVRDRNARKQKKSNHRHREHGNRQTLGDTHKRERDGKWSPRVREMREGAGQVTP